MTKVTATEQIQPAIAKAFAEAQEVLVEAFMDGTEITCGCYKTKDKSVVFPITDVYKRQMQRNALLFITSERV